MLNDAPTPAQVYFWETYCGPIVNALDQGCYMLPEVQARFFENRQRIFERYNVSAITYCADTVSVLAKMGSSIKFGPRIHFFLKILMPGFDQMKAQCGAAKAGEVLRDSIAIGILHEIDHLALKTFGGDGSFFTITKHEQITWAATCEHTLRPVIEIHKRTLLTDLTQTYKAWLTGGRSVESNAWRQHIRKIYRQ